LIFGFCAIGVKVELIWNSEALEQDMQRPRRLFLHIFLFTCVAYKSMHIDENSLHHRILTTNRTRGAFATACRLREFVSHTKATMTTRSVPYDGKLLPPVQ
jgi:hypothetical protein